MYTFRKSQNNSPSLPSPAPELDKLNIFVGKWHAEGDSYSEGQSPEQPQASAVKWTSDESYEWMSGKYFLVHRWDAKVGTRIFKGLEIIGYDVVRKEFFTRMFDNGGNAVKYKVTVEENTWTFTEPHTRAVAVFGEDNSVITFEWEWRHEGGDWLPLCNRKATRTS